MTPLDFFLIIDCTGTDPSSYKMKGFVTGEKFYPTIAALRSAFTAGELGMEYDQTLDSDWAMVDYKPELGVRPLEERLAPATLEIGGKRYKVDETNQYIEYMGWSFYIAFSRTLGVMFYDIKFKGERILYELSMQEATAQYGGNQPKAANTVYHDTYYSLGAEMGTLIEGYGEFFPSLSLMRLSLILYVVLRQIVHGALLFGISPIIPATARSSTRIRFAYSRPT